MDQQCQEGSAAVKATVAARPVTWLTMTLEQDRVGNGPTAHPDPRQSAAAMNDSVSSAGSPPVERPTLEGARGSHERRRCRERWEEVVCINDALKGLNNLAG